ncbi:MAG TPA: hypothetical protein VJ111_10545 [Chitinophagaceae bacterium]|nr:hypothetical protein [Chitinophagaceae bacterium]
MEQQLVHSNGELVITPSATSSASDFDFYVGHWNIYNRKLKTRLNGCAKWAEKHGNKTGVCM